MLARLAALSQDHFNVAPDEVNWGHVGTLAVNPVMLPWSEIKLSTLAFKRTSTPAAKARRPR